MRYLLIFFIMLVCNGCVTSSLWEHAYNNTHSIIHKNEISVDKLENYKKMSLTNDEIQIDPVTESVYVKRSQAKRVKDYTVTALATPFILIYEIPVTVIVKLFEGDKDWLIIK